MGDTDKALLIVDDSSTMRRIMRLTLSKCGFTNVEEAENGKEALSKAQEKQYDCVITDWNMPEMDGLELTKSLRQLDNYASIPIMMATTEGGKEDIVEALSQGVNSYVVKPFNESVLKGKMDSLFGG